MENVPCTYRVSVKALMKDSDGRVLLLREKDGSWELPGGGLEHGESPKEALVREVTEETGLSIEHVGEQPVAFWTIGRETAFPNGLQWFAFVLYEVEVSGTFRPDPAGGEAEEVAYFSAVEAKALRLHDNTRPYFL